VFLFSLYLCSNSLSLSSQEIALSEVLQARGPAHLAVPPLPGDGGHTLEVVTASLVYCVAAGESGPAWESAIRRALMPVQSSGEESRGEPGFVFKYYATFDYLFITITSFLCESVPIPDKNLTLCSDGVVRINTLIDL